jgi:hypothetical protein
MTAHEAMNAVLIGIIIYGFLFGGLCIVICAAVESSIDKYKRRKG